MTRVATSWLVYRLTGSPLLLGLVGFVGQILTFLLAPFAGVLVDRVNRKQLMLWTQALAGLQSVAMAVLTLANVITVHEIIGLSALQGLINAFDMPARQSLLVQMVEDKQDLGNAIALNSSMVNMARLIGPALAGLIIGALGEGYCFAIDAASYLAVIASLLLMRLRATALKRASTSAFYQLKEGWAYVSGFSPVRTILLLFALISLMATPLMVLLPIFASDILGGGPHTLGFLTAASGAGALISAVALALRKSVLGLTTTIQISALIFGAGLILFSRSKSVPISMSLMFVIGFAMTQGMAASNTVIQTLVPEHQRGRAMSYYTMAFVGMAPFGSILAGELAHYSSASRVVMISGACCLAGATWFSTQLKRITGVMQPIYIQMGIMQTSIEPEVKDQAGH